MGKTEERDCPICGKRFTIYKTRPRISCGNQRCVHLVKSRASSASLRKIWQNGLRDRRVPQKVRNKISRTLKTAYRIGHLRSPTLRPSVRRKISEAKYGYEWDTTHQATIRPGGLDLAWAAGFLEGEGTFVGHHGNGITAVQVNARPLRKLLAIFGGTIRRDKRHRLRGNRQLSYHWAVHGSRARGIMMTLYKFMSPQRQQQIRFSLRRVYHP